MKEKVIKLLLLLLMIVSLFGGITQQHSPEIGQTICPGPLCNGD